MNIKDQVKRIPFRDNFKEIKWTKLIESRETVFKNKVNSCC